MSQRTMRGGIHPLLISPMRGRDPTEQCRAATPLELFFDLVVVVAVALAADRLHHAVVGGVGVMSVLSYSLVFVAIWLAWMNFTWFASAYDTNDVLYRVNVLVIMTGALVMAAGVPRIFDQRDFGLGILGYVIMRITLVTQWIRVALDDAPRRRTALRYAIGITACQIGWVSLLLAPQLWPLAWLTLLPLDLLTPVWAERAGTTTFHPEHITERYGLFMIIVLGESVLAASLAIQSILGESGMTFELVSVIIGCLLIVYSMWWIYFDRPEEHFLDNLHTTMMWNYLHLPIFAAVGAVGAGLVVAIEETSGHAHLGAATAGTAVAVPIVVYLLSLWALYLRLLHDRFTQLLLPLAIALVISTIFTPAPVLAIGLVLAALVAVKVALHVRDSTSTEILGATESA